MLARQAELDSERKRLSFSAYTTQGDAPRLLDELRDQMAGLDVEVADVGNAIEVGKQRVADAKQALAGVHEQQRRDQVAAELKKLQATAKRLDESLSAFTAAGRDMVDVVDALYALGHPHPNRTQIDALGFRALSTALAGSFWAGHFQRLQPAQRVTFAQLGAAWAGTVNTNETEAAA
jgi:hypothetical protein